MIKQKENKMKFATISMMGLIIISIIGFVVSIFYLFSVIFLFEKVDLTDFLHGAVFGVMTAALASSIRVSYKKIK